MLKKRRLARFPALVLLLLCLAGCARADPAADYDGVWYAAKNGVECRFGDGKIYRDDSAAQEGQSLAGIYSVVDDHVEANLAGTGSVSQVRKLYLVAQGQGEVLCDRADGSGQIYFYRDPLAALAALEEQEEQAPADAGQAPLDAPGQAPAPEVSGPGETPGIASEAPEVQALAPFEPDAGTGGEPSPASRAIPTETPAASEAPAAKSASGQVWIPQSGSKYHSDPNCSGMKDPRQVSLSEAQSMGYTPCKRCY